MTSKGIRRLLTLSVGRKCLLLDTLWALAWAVGRVKLMPFRALALQLGKRDHQAASTLTPEQEAWAKDTEWMIAAICRRLPMKPTCLMQAAAAKSLLARRGVPATLYIGVAPVTDKRRRINAHAWLQCGRRIVTGKAEAQNFRPMVWFG